MAKSETEKTPREAGMYEPKRRNAQGAHDGGAHRPEEFDSQNPAKQVEQPGKTDT